MNISTGLVLALALALTGRATAEVFPESIEDCAPQGPPLCYERAARRSGEWAVAESRLRQRLAQDPQDEAIQYALGQLLSDRNDPGAERWFRAAAEGCASRGGAVCELQAALALSEWYSQRARIAESERFLAQARAAAERAHDERATIRVEIQNARLAISLGRHADAIEILEPLEPRLTYDDARGDWLGVIAVALWGVGRTNESLTRFEALRELNERRGDRFQLSQTLHNVVLLRSTRGSRPDSETHALLQQALQLALSSGNRTSEISIRLSLAQDGKRSNSERLRDLTIALESSTKQGRIEDRCFALRLRSQYTERETPSGQREALQWAQRGLDCAQELGSPFHLARAHLVYAQRWWDAGDVQQGSAAATVALDAIERIRDLQPDSLSRVGTFGRWLFFYERFIGMVLRGDQPPSAEAIELAMTIAERRRARTLLDQLDAAGGTEQVAQRHPGAAPRESLLLQASDLQRRLSAGGLSATDRAELSRRLTTIEGEATALARNIAHDDAAFSLLRLPSIPRLRQLQQTLAEDEALLSYVLPEELSYGSRPRVFVLTRSTVRVESLSLESIGDRVTLFEHLLARRDNSDISAARHLHRELVEKATRGLPPQITHLTIVPDGALGRLPWGALRDASDRPLALRYAIALAPSASLWFGWRQRPAMPASLALVFSDPTPPRDARGKDLPRLPLARSEALRVAQLWGARSRLFSGVAASEHALRKALESRVGIVHIAAHTVVDTRHPENTAIALAPGGGEDGWLQERELIGLDLKDRCIVLSSCSGAGGTELAGEGTLSLARACFLGGARAVVAAAAPVRDDEARRVMEPFFRGLAEGRSVVDALTAAQRERFAAGDATYGWAGVTAYGDGAWRIAR